MPSTDMPKDAMKIFGLAGMSAQTSVVIPALTRRGLRVSTLKHAHHAFDLDKPGKDSYEHRRAGATEVMVSSANRWALVHELRGASELTSRELIERMTPVDLLLIEGFKREAHDKLEVHRPSLGKPLLCTEDPHIVALASDAPVPGLTVPRLDLGNTEAIADFIIAHCGLADRARGAA